jgi:predicted metal-dependent hydrolase
MPEANVEEYVRAALVDWYRTRASKYLQARYRAWAGKLKVEPQALALSEPATRWGSTSKDGTVRLNWKIVQAPTPLVDYVVAHELCHLVHRDHGREFWSMLGRVMPDYEVRKRRLRELGPELIW